MAETKQEASQVPRHAANAVASHGFSGLPWCQALRAETARPDAL